MNGDGLWDAINEPIIATNLSDGSGLWSFGGLPDGSYLVWVNDTANILANLDQSGDPDATLDNRSAVTLVGADNLNQDFGYAPPNHGSGDGLIGDTIFLDRNGNNLFDPGEGLESVAGQAVR